MPDQLAFLPERVLTLAAMPGAGYRVQFYQSGTTTPVTVFTSQNLSTPHPSPLVCDAAGVFPAVFSPGGAIKAVITKPDGSSYYTLDPVFRVPTSSSGAAEISFEPTPGLPFENVQDAIEGAAASAASGFTPFGLGVTGTNALISNLNATNTASGSYRFDNTTTGTFPTGVAATDTGTVQVDRENSGDAVMRLQSGAADREFIRRMASSVWGSWREVITVNDGATEGDTIYRTSTSWTRLAKGLAGQVLQMNSGATAPEWVTPGLTFSASTATTSGTAHDITGVPASAREIEVYFHGVSLTAANAMLVQVLVGGVPVTTGYVSAGSSSGAVSTATSAFVMRYTSASETVSGIMRLVRTDTGVWAATHGVQSSGNTSVGGGDVTGVGTVNGIRLTRDSSGTFDAGSFRIGWR